MKYVLSVACALFLIGCGNSAPTESSVPAQNEMQAADQTPSDETNISSPLPVEPVPEATQAPISEPTPVAAEEKAKPAPAPAPKAPAPAPAAPKPAASASIDGGALFSQKCASCHGMKAEKSALGKSQIIAGWDESKIKDALKGYQNGTYGKEMKAVMQGQAKALDDASIDALAKHVSHL